MKKTGKSQEKVAFGISEAEAKQATAAIRKLFPRRHVKVKLCRHSLPEGFAERFALDKQTVTYGWRIEIGGTNVCVDVSPYPIKSYVMVKRKEVCQPLMTYGLEIYKDSDERLESEAIRVYDCPTGYGDALYTKPLQAARATKRALAKLSKLLV